VAVAFDVVLSQLSENRELLCRGMCPAVVRGAHLPMQVQGSPSRPVSPGLAIPNA